MKFFIKDFFSKCEFHIYIYFIFTEEILNGRLPFLCNVNIYMMLDRVLKTLLQLAKKNDFLKTFKTWFPKLSPSNYHESV